LIKQPVLAPAKIWFVTQNVVPLTGRDQTALNLAQSPLWGLGKVIALEQPEMWGGLIDLELIQSGKTLQEIATTLLTDILKSDSEDQMAYQAGQRYVARLVPSRLKPSQTFTLHPNGCYWITGGLGSLGLRVAQWLITQGARYLILTGRRAPFAQAQNLIDQWQESGTHILITDVTHSTSVSIQTLQNLNFLNQ
jgi:hypothetical protein